MRDNSIYDKYLNMKPKEKKKIDFTVKFDSKIQKIGVILFGIGLIFVCLGFSFMFFRQYDDKVVPENNDPNVVMNANVKDFEAITSLDGKIAIDSTTVTYKKDLGLSEMNFNITVNEDMAELPIKITFEMGEEDVVIVDLLSDLHANETISLFKQNENDLSMAESWKVEATTREDLAQNYGFEFNN